MKLTQIYSNSITFKSVKFNDKFNIVLGDIKYEEDLNKDSHNLGKSTLIALIDFLLLKTIDKKHFFRNSAFENHIFFLELELNNDSYLTIMRAIRNSSKVSIKSHESPYMDLRNEIDWDYFELGLNASDPNNNPIEILNRYLGFDVLSGYSFRNTVNYFFRTQNDYIDVFKLNKFRGKDLDWKPILFELLGFSSKDMIDKYKLDSEKNQKETLISQIEAEFSVCEEDVDKIKGLIEIKQQERLVIIKWLDGFDFYQQDEIVQKELITDIESKISTLNTEKYNLDYEINQIDKSLQLDIPYDIQEIKSIYEEVQVLLPGQLVKSYQELLEFNKKVFNERKQYLSKAKENKQQRLKQIDIKLRELNRQRMNSLSTFTHTDTFAKYNRYREQLINVERELEHYTSELENLDVIKRLNQELVKIDEQINKAVNAIKEQIDNSNHLYRSIQKDFHDYVKTIINQDGMVSLSVNQNGNVDFNDSIVNEHNESTSQNDGHTYKKILCACFDLALIKNYMSNSFYRTVYHDGCLESLDPRKQKQYLRLVRGLSDEYGFQYILTALKSDIPSSEVEDYSLKPYEIAVTLSDEEDDSGRLFGFVF